MSAGLVVDATRRPATAIWSAIGTYVQLMVTQPSALPAARRLVEEELLALDVACSRFRPDSEVRRLESSGGGPQLAGPLLLEVVEVALAAAAATDGDVDPTLGSALVDLGYDRDYRLLDPERSDARAAVRVVRRIPGWRAVRVDRDGGVIDLPPGTLLDLGATAKAWCADRCAALVAARLGCGALVSLGGDIATAAPPGSTDPVEGWEVTIQDRPDHPDDRTTIVQLPAGGALATSSTSSRTWRSASGTLHHILDPRSLQPAPVVWRYVTVAARRCVDANTASTAALIRGHAAPAWLSRVGLAARLVGADGSIVRVGTWPSELPAERPPELSTELPSEASR